MGECDKRGERLPTRVLAAIKRVSDKVMDATLLQSDLDDLARIAMREALALPHTMSAFVHADERTRERVGSEVVAGAIERQNAAVSHARPNTFYCAAGGCESQCTNCADEAPPSTALLHPFVSDRPRENCETCGEPRSAHAAPSSTRLTGDEFALWLKAWWLNNDEWREEMRREFGPDIAQHMRGVADMIEQPWLKSSAPSATLTPTVAAALGRIADGSPRREDSIHGPRLRCKHCGHAWVIGSEAEHHDEACAFVIARDALGRRADGTAAKKGD